MKTLFCIGLLSAVLPLALPAAVEDFKSYADTEALRKSWTGFGGGNPAPSASLSTLDGAPAMELSTSGEPGDKVIVRELAVQPGERLTFTMHSDMKNAPGAYAYVALRSDRNAGNLVLHDFRLVPGQPVRVEIPNEGRFNWQDQVAMLICLHDAGAPMRVTVGAIDLPGAAPAREFHDTPEARRERREKLLHGRTVQIDTAFPYYHNRSNESIASELRVNGFDGVYYYTGTDTGLRPGLVGEMQRQKLGVGLMTLPSLVYWSEAQLAERLPAGWRDWLIEFTGSGMDIYRFIGFVYPEYNAWYKNYLNGMLLRHRFDAFTFAEIMYPIYDGPEKNPPFYGDVSPGFQAAFKRATGSETFPNFTDPADPDYFRTNTGLYRQLVEYRVRTIDDFYDDIINGPGGAREAAPGILFATWTLGINIPDGVAKLREWEGNDIVTMIRRVKPDLHFIQTHAPDWANPALPGDYPLAYQPFFDAVRTANPDVKIGMQADLGSLGPSRRDPAWQKQFYDACRKAGVDTTTYYEFGLRWEIYSQPPRLCEIRRDGDTLLLVFDQRLNAESAILMKGRELRGKDRSYRIAECRWDGNLLRLKPDALPAADEELTVPVGGVADDPAVRFPASNLEPMPRGPVNTIPSGTETTLPVLGSFSGNPAR